MDENRLDTLEGLAAAIGGNPRYIAQGYPFEGGQMYCPHCSDLRRMEVQVKKLPDELLTRCKGNPAVLQLSVHPTDLPPSLFIYTCLQCKSKFTSVAYIATSGLSLAVFPRVPGGVATKNTPPAVAYYLDQASRSHSVGANSAAIAMYRAALEQLLYEQGFTNGMLNQKIGELQKAITAGIAPKWAKELDIAYLTVIKDLGNAAIHPNDGDVTKQDALDKALIVHVETTMQQLLDVAYEQPAKEAERLAKLKMAAVTFKS